jgi:glucokinase
MTTNVVAVDVGGTTIKAGRYDRNGTAAVSVVAPTPRGTEPILDEVTSLAQSLQDDDTAAFGVVVPGVVDPRAGVAWYSVHLGWRDVPLRASMTERLGRPVVIDHDVAAAAVAEGVVRTGDLLFVAIGTGIATAHLVDGSVWRGATGQAGELGHVTVQPDGEACACGRRGCLEVYAAGSGLARRYAAAGGVRGATAREISRRLDVDPAAAEVWRTATDAIGLALATASQLFDPAAIVLGGGVARAGERLREPVRKALASRLTWREAPNIQLSALGAEAGRRGAAELAWRRVDGTTHG